MNREKLAEDIYMAALGAVKPASLVSKFVSFADPVISAGGLSLSLNNVDNIFVIGAGKASAAMASELETILGGKITGGHVVVKYGHSLPLRRITITEAGHPVPDANGFRATRTIADIAQKAGVNDLVICLLSGGGSALLADVPDNINEDEMMRMNDLLVRSGADIEAVNTVRKHLSNIKGGRLASMVNPATLVNMILSDVPGDSPEVIASGPAYPDSTTFADALQVISVQGIQKDVPASILAYLIMGEEGLIPESPKPGDPVFENVHNILIGNNRTALDAAALKARESGFRTVIIKDDMDGDTAEYAKRIVKAAIECQSDMEIEKPACLLFGGETTLRVTGTGTGGRNQHMALSCAIQLMGTGGITILAAGTDGTDGPTDAAGAVVDGDTFKNAIGKNISPGDHIDRFDSYNFFTLAGGHIKTGPTLTNVMDIVVVLVCQGLND
jgi:glycerate 2-kinase